MVNNQAPPLSDLFGDHQPTWLNESMFLNPTFTSESYISDFRTFVPLETLRSEHESHLTSLKNELVELINRDFGDFVNLSSKLVDVDGAVLRMRAPSVEFREKVVGFKSDLEMSLSELKSKLRERSLATEAREVLELLINTWHLVSKVEKLINELHSVPVDGSNRNLHTGEKSHLSNGEHSKNGRGLRETQSMLLERIASEMNRLKFYFAHGKDLPFIENMEKRIQNAISLLDTSLGNCFVDGLTHKDEKTVINCLRAYAAVDNTRNAEDIFRSTVVAPLVKKVIPNCSSGVVSGYAGDELEEDYKQIKQLIMEDCTFLLQISSTGYCTSRSAVDNFRAEAVYVDFMKQWNMEVYYSVRYHEIAGSLESTLVGSKLTPIQKSDSEHGLTLKQSLTLLECLKSCWREDEVEQVKRILSAYVLTKKPPPVRPSHYVSGMLRPLKVFLDGEWATSYLKEDTKGKLIHGVAFKITGRYYELAVVPVNLARKTHSSLERIRQGASARHGVAYNVSEANTICMQLFLDIQEYGRNLATLGVEAAKIPSYTSLWKLVAPQDRQAVIRF